MSSPYVEPHPTYYMRGFGITDTPAISAVGYLLVLQAGFLAVIFHNFFVTAQGYELSGSTPRVLSAIGLVGTLIWAIWQIRSLRRRLVRSAAQERAAVRPIFDPLRDILNALIARSTVTRTVELFYHTVNEYALHVTERTVGADRVVVGLARVEQLAQKPALTQAMLGHEVSHLECRQTHFEVWARFGLLLYLQVAGCLLAVMVQLAAYLEPEIVDGTAIATLFPEWDPTVLVRFTLPIALQILITVTVVSFGYFIPMRRELLHDVRSMQLTGQDALERDRFRGECLMRRKQSWAKRLEQSWTDARGLHPSPCRRSRTLASRDWLVLDVGIYPLVAGVIVTMPLVLAGPVSQALGLDDSQLSQGATVVGGILIYAVARADMGRLAALRIEGRRWVVRLLGYSACMSAGAMIVGGVLTLRFAVARTGWSSGVRIVLQAQVPRFAMFTVFFGCLLAAVSYLVAIARLARGSAVSGWARRATREGAIMLLLLLVFAIQSMSLALPSVIASISTLVVCVAFPALVLTLRSRCESCGHRRPGIFMLRATCSSCGHAPRVVPSFQMVRADP